MTDIYSDALRDRGTSSSDIVSEINSVLTEFGLAVRYNTTGEKSIVGDALASLVFEVVQLRKQLANDQRREPLRMIDLDAIRQRAAAATRGPWAWDGWHSSQSIALVTQHSGMIYVMSFKRWGMQNAQPVFNTGKMLVPASELPIFAVAPDATSVDDPRVYRSTLSGIRHPDATFIAHSRQDVDDLLAYIDELEAKITDLKTEGE